MSDFLDFDTPYSEREMNCPTCGVESGECIDMIESHGAHFTKYLPSGTYHQSRIRAYEKAKASAEAREKEEEDGGK